MTNKLPPELDNPLDTLYYRVCEYTSEFFHKHGFTPNMITTIGNVFRIMTLYLMYKRRFRLAAVVWLFAYYFDCLDGYVARKYKMASKWGSMYDHVSDEIFSVLIIVAIWRINPKLFVWFLAIIILYYIPFLYFYSLQQSYYQDDTHTGLDMVIVYSMFPKTTKTNAHRILPYMRYFGSATGILIIAVFIAMLGKF